MLADSLFRPPITPFCSLLPSYHLLFSHLTPLTLFSHLTTSLFSHLTTSLFSHLTTSLFSHLTTSYSPILPPPYSPILRPPTTNLSPLSYHSPTYSPCFHQSHLFHPFPSPPPPSSPPPHLFCNAPSLPTCKFSTRKSRTYSTPLFKTFDFQK